MKSVLLLCLLSVSLVFGDEGNPKIDYEGFKKLTQEVEDVRASNRVSEADFLKMAAEEGTVILDTRSREKYEELHVKGAIHLNFSDFSAESLAALIPDKATRILIYCNNNFGNEPMLFAEKGAAVALNVPTFINLHAYGYENVFELMPFLNVKTAKIPFAGSTISKRVAE